MNNLAELSPALAVITVSGLIAITITGIVACRIITVVANTTDRTGLAACLKAVAEIIRAVRRHRP